MLAQLDVCQHLIGAYGAAVRVVALGLVLGACVDSEVVLGPCCSASAEETFSLQADATGRSRFRLTAINGNVLVVGTASSQTVLIEGTRRVESSSQSDADVNLANLQVEVSQTADEVAVRTTQPTNSENRNFIVDYQITVPAGLAVQLTSVNGNIAVDGVTNGVDVVNTNGNISLQAIVGSVDVDLVNGNIDAEVTPPATGTIGLASVNGNLSLHVPVDVSAELSMILTNGTLSVVNLAVQNQTSSSTSLTGTLGAGNGEITLATINGNIMITGF